MPGLLPVKMGCSIATHLRQRTRIEFMNYLVTEIGEGELHVMAAPKPRLLHNHTKYLKMQGITKVLSLLEPTEAENLQLGAESYYCNQEGLAFENFPIRDHDVTTAEALRPVAKRLLNEITEGEKLVVHCFAGIGRTGIVTSAILIEHGFSAIDAMNLITEKRQFKVPETQEQVEFVEQYARSK